MCLTAIGVRLLPYQATAVDDRCDAGGQQRRPEPTPRFVLGGGSDHSEAAPDCLELLTVAFPDPDERPDAVHRSSSIGQAQHVAKTPADTRARIARRWFCGLTRTPARFVLNLAIDMAAVTAVPIK